MQTVGADIVWASFDFAFILVERIENASAGLSSLDSQKGKRRLCVE